MNVNKVMLGGNLTRDPEMRFLATGENSRAVANFGLAINHRYKSADGQAKEEVTFVDVECWGKTAELCGQYLTKGRGCFIEGRLKLDSWEDKDTKAKRSKLKVVADSVQFLGGKGVGDGSDDAEPAPAKRAEPRVNVNMTGAKPIAGNSELPPF